MSNFCLPQLRPTPGGSVASVCIVDRRHLASTASIWI
jgi:hypothetical protein